MYNNLSVPDILIGIIFYNSENRFYSFNITSVQLLAEEQLYVPDLERPFFVWQKQNIRWMINRESSKTTFNIPILNRLYWGVNWPTHIWMGFNWLWGHLGHFGTFGKFPQILDLGGSKIANGIHFLGVPGKPYN